MHERLYPLVLKAAKELRECAESGEHPGAAERAVRHAYGECEGLYLYGRADPAWYAQLARVLGGCETAVRLYPYDPERVCAVLVPEETRRLAPLVKLAEAAREALELCC